MINVAAFKHTKPMQIAANNLFSNPALSGKDSGIASFFSQVFNIFLEKRFGTRSGLSIHQLSFFMVVDEEPFKREMFSKMIFDGE
jgi:hypothetical protein